MNEKNENGGNLSAGKQRMHTMHRTQLDVEREKIQRQIPFSSSECQNSLIHKNNCSQRENILLQINSHICTLIIG